MRRLAGVGLAVAAWCSASPVFASSTVVTLQDRQSAACYDDVQRLCREFVPDIAKTEACMQTKRSQVSKKCSDMYDVTK